MIDYGLPLYLSNTLNSFVTTLRGVILAYFTTNVLIGNFNTAMNFAVLITLVSSLVATALFPAFSKLDSNGGEAETMFTYSVKYTSALIIPAAAFVSAMSRDLIFLLYGASLGRFFSGWATQKLTSRPCCSTQASLPSAIALTSALQVEGLLTAIILATAASTIYSLTVATRKCSLQIDVKSSAGICLAAFVAEAPVTPPSLIFAAAWNSEPRISCFT